MTDCKHDAAAADENSLMSKYFDMALRTRETNTKAGGHPSREFLDRSHAELPPQRADSE